MGYSVLLHKTSHTSQTRHVWKCQWVRQRLHLWGPRNPWQARGSAACIHSVCNLHSHMHKLDSHIPTYCLNSWTFTMTSFTLKLGNDFLCVPGPLIVLGRVRSMSGHQRCSEARLFQADTKCPSPWMLHAKGSEVWTPLVSGRNLLVKTTENHWICAC